jgi:hypothetical protein
MIGIHRRLAAGACAVGVLLASAAANAGTATGAVTQVVIVQGGALAYVTFSNGVNNKDACHTGTSGALVFDPTTEAGKAMLSVATAALLSGKAVVAHGTSGNACLTYTFIAPSPVPPFSQTVEILGQLQLAQ